ncbi:MAG: 3-deoxy-8-phosphooctulonate synthase [Bacteroidetes bacterium]|nr:3-deoxy-8-phosphooctulonate synthase [Bacteroidota bacterium]
MHFLNQLFPGFDTKKQFFLLAGPCVVENKTVMEETATELKRISEKHQIPLIFKASYTKANRSSVHSFSGIGQQEALSILAETGAQYQLPLVTDIHADEEAQIAAQYVDVLQIPAFLCRQTSLLLAAGQTGKIVNIKKGQFLSPESMQFAIDKVRSTGNENVMVTERGTTFGYQDLVVDFRSFPIMKQFGKPCIMDCTHALQQPNQSNGVTGGRPELIETIAKCGIAAGADGLFIETHPDPSKALSDGANMLNLKDMDELMRKLVLIKNALIA